MDECTAQALKSSNTVSDIQQCRYALARMEHHGLIHKRDRVWQLTFGGGFKYALPLAVLMFAGESTPRSP